jgi:hypothetical protein
VRRGDHRSEAGVFGHRDRRPARFSRTGLPEVAAALHRRRELDICD